MTAVCHGGERGSAQGWARRLNQMSRAHSEHRVPGGKCIGTFVQYDGDGVNVPNPRAPVYSGGRRPRTLASAASRSSSSRWVAAISRSMDATRSCAALSMRARRSKGTCGAAI